MSTPALVRGRSSYAGFRATIKAVGTGERGRRDLSFEEAREAMCDLLAGRTSAAQAGAFLLAMRIKGESPAELAGFAQALREACATAGCDTNRPVVACGGAYDGVVEAPHLTLAAAALAAACGAAVVLHSGRTLGPKFGVTPVAVLAALGGPDAPTLAESERMLARAGLTLVYTPAALEGWERLAELRDEVGVRGPLHAAERLLDFFGARRFVASYTHSHYAQLLIGALGQLDAESAIAVRGIEGSEVLRPGRPTASDANGTLALPSARGLAIEVGGGAGPSAAAVEAALAGKAGPGVERAVTLTAGLILYAAGLARDPAAGAARAARAVANRSGARTLAAMLA